MARTVRLPSGELIEIGSTSNLATGIRRFLSKSGASPEDIAKTRAKNKRNAARAASQTRTGSNVTTQKATAVASRKQTRTTKGNLSNLKAAAAARRATNRTTSNVTSKKATAVASRKQTRTTKGNLANLKTMGAAQRTTTRKPTIASQKKKSSNLRVARMTGSGRESKFAPKKMSLTKKIGTRIKNKLTTAKFSAKFKFTAARKAALKKAQEISAKLRKKDKT